jgi:hypothetical protein
LLSSSFTRAQTDCSSYTARATVYARAISSAEAPVSSRSRKKNDVPAVLTTSLTTQVVTISRFSGWASICSAKRSRSGVGK